MLFLGWLLTFSLVVCTASISIITVTDLERVNSTKSNQKVPEPEITFIKNITRNFKERNGSSAIVPRITVNGNLLFDNTLTSTTKPLNISSYATNYQNQFTFLGSDAKSHIRDSVLEHLPPVQRKSLGDVGNTQNSETVLENHSIEFLPIVQPVIGQIDRSISGNIAEERQFRPPIHSQTFHRGTERPNNLRGPILRPIRTALVPPPPIPNPVLNPPRPTHPDISLIPLQSVGDSGTNDVLVERFPPYNDELPVALEPFPPFNVASPSFNEVPIDQPLPQLFTQEIPQPLFHQAPATLTHEAAQPQEVPQLPLQQITPVTQKSAQQNSPPPALKSFQHFFLESAPTQSPPRPPSQEINQPEVQQFSQQQSQQFTQVLPQEAPQQQPQQFSQPILQQITQPSPQEPQQLFQTITQQQPQSIPPPLQHQQFRPSSIPPLPPRVPPRGSTIRPPRRVPPRGSTIRPLQFRSPRPQRVVQQRLRIPRQQRVARRPAQPVKPRDTRQLKNIPRTAIPGRPRSRERQLIGREKFLPTGPRQPRGRSSSFSSVWAALQSVFEPSGGRSRRPSTPRGRRFRF